MAREEQKYVFKNLTKRKLLMSNLNHSKTTNKQKQINNRTWRQEEEVRPAASTDSVPVNSPMKSHNPPATLGSQNLPRSQKPAG